MGFEFICLSKHKPWPFTLSSILVVDGTNAEVLRNLWLTPSEPGLTDKSPPTSPLEGASIWLFLLNIPIKSEVLPRDTLWRDIISFVVCLFTYWFCWQILMLLQPDLMSQWWCLLPWTTQARVIMLQELISLNTRYHTLLQFSCKKLVEWNYVTMIGHSGGAQGKLG